MTRSILIWTVAISFCAATSVAAQHGHGSSPKPTQTHATSHGPSTHGSTSTHGSSSAHGSSTTHGSSSGHSTKAPHTTKGTNTTKGTKAPKPTKTTTTVTTEKPSKKTTTASTSTTTTTSGSTTTLTPVQQKLQKNTNLAAKLQSRLPEGTDLMKAAAGFKNLGQFVSAVNTSYNLGLSFTEIKTRVVEQNMSLGQAIQDVKSLSATTSTTSTTTTAARKRGGQ